jgi:hypothetical protein
LAVSAAASPMLTMSGTCLFKVCILNTCNFQARERLSEYTSKHEAEISTAKAEADALMLEYTSLDVNRCTEESQAEIEALRVARKQEEEATHTLNKEQQIVDFVRKLVAIEEFDSRLPERLLEGRKDAGVLASMALELSNMRSFVDRLPTRQGRAPAINKVLGPLVREMAKRVRAGVRMGVSRRIIVSSDAIQVRLVPALTQSECHPQLCPPVYVSSLYYICVYVSSYSYIFVRVCVCVCACAYAYACACACACACRCQRAVKERGGTCEMLG